MVGKQVEVIGIELGSGVSSEIEDRMKKISDSISDLKPDPPIGNLTEMKPTITMISL